LSQARRRRLPRRALPPPPGPAGWRRTAASRRAGRTYPAHRAVRRSARAANRCELLPIGVWDGRPTASLCASLVAPRCEGRRSRSRQPAPGRPQDGAFWDSQDHPARAARRHNRGVGKRAQLGAFLQSRRARVAPQDVGIEPLGVRRVRPVNPDRRLSQPRTRRAQPRPPYVPRPAGPRALPRLGGGTCAATRVVTRTIPAWPRW
jgi:hypothetical protein